MSRKISENVSEKLEQAAQDALEQIDPFEQLMNAGVEYEKEQKPKRKRRTKAEILEARKQEEENHENNKQWWTEHCHIRAIVNWDNDDNADLPTIVEIPNKILVNDYNSDTISDYLSDTFGFCHKGFTLEWPACHKDFDEFCQWEIEQAHLNDKEEPDFDYRNLYERGDKVYLVRHYDKMALKEMVYCSLRTIYPRMMIGVIDKQGCQCIGFTDKDNIFINRNDAEDYFNTINAKTSDEYNEDTGKKKRKRKKTVEEDEDITDSESYDDESEDEDNE